MHSCGNELKLDASRADEIVCTYMCPRTPMPRLRRFALRADRCRPFPAALCAPAPGRWGVLVQRSGREAPRARKYADCVRPCPGADGGSARMRGSLVVKLGHFRGIGDTYFFKAITL